MALVGDQTFSILAIEFQPSICYLPSSSRCPLPSLSRVPTLLPSLTSPYPLPCTAHGLSPCSCLPVCVGGGCVGGGWVGGGYPALWQSRRSTAAASCAACCCCVSWWWWAPDDADDASFIGGSSSSPSAHGCMFCRAWREALLRQRGSGLLYMFLDASACKLIMNFWAACLSASLSSAVCLLKKGKR